jgi:hypothetical protein
VNVVFNKPLNPEPLPDDRVFENSGVGSDYGTSETDAKDPEQYTFLVRALIEDSQTFEESVLQPERDTLLQYFYGDLPPVESVDEDGVPTTSTVVSTDVRDTVMAIMPSLIRIFCSPEHIVFCAPNHDGQEEMAKQATEYIEYVFWEDNPGFMLLHDAFKDALSTKTCVLHWYNDTETDVVTQEFENITQEQIQLLISENESIEVVETNPSESQPGLMEVTLRWEVGKPMIKIVGVPLDEFRIDRKAKTVDDAALIGFDTIKRLGELIAAGYDETTLRQHTGATQPYSPDRIFRNIGLDEGSPLEDYEIRYGEYYIRIDKDGDGIEELRKICVVGDNFEILADKAVQWANFAVGCPDPKPHTLIGDCPADLVTDIQRIKTNMLRGSLDSLAQSIWPRTVFNELMVNVDDVLNEEIGAGIRTRGVPQETLMSLQHQFVGQPVFTMFEAMERLRQVRTGISDASKGVDPKALQSTSLTGVEAIISGAQERIELIARLMAETLLKPLFKGILREITAHPNQQRTVQLRGKWADVNPSTYDPSMRISVNPTLGKGTDIARLMALTEVKNTQIMVIEKFGVSNPVVGPQEFMATVEDMMAIANVKNTKRYFKEVTPEVMMQVAQQPKEPDPALVLAQAEMEKRKVELLKDKTKQIADQQKLKMDDDFRRDQLMVTSMLDAAKIEAQFSVDVNEMRIMEQNQAEETASAEGTGA